MPDGLLYNKQTGVKALKEDFPARIYRRLKYEQQ